MRASRSKAERFLGWWMSNLSPRRARPSAETFSGMRILKRLGVEGDDDGETAEGAMIRNWLQLIFVTLLW